MRRRGNYRPWTRWPSNHIALGVSPVCPNLIAQTLWKRRAAVNTATNSEKRAEGLIDITMKNNAPRPAAAQYPGSQTPLPACGECFLEIRSGCRYKGAGGRRKGARA